MLIRCVKHHQRLHFLWRLWFYGVDRKISFIFYQSVLESVNTYGLSTWYSNLSVKSKSKILYIVQTAMKMIERKDYPSIQTLYKQCTLNEAKRFLCDPSHVLYPCYELLPSGRRYRIPHHKQNRFKSSFLLVSIRLVNMD